MSKYKNLEAACGGAINPETLATFAKAMREYEHFMDAMGAMFGPADVPRGAVIAEEFGGDEG